MPIKRLSQSSLLTFEKYSSMLAGNAAYEPVETGYEWLETTVLPSNQASVIFSDLGTKYSSTYKHLQIRMTGRSDDPGSSNARDLRIRVNGDTGLNYSAHRLRAEGTVVVSDASVNQNAINAYTMFPRPDNPAGQFGAGIIDLLDFSSSSKNKTFRIFGGLRPTGESGVWLCSGFWNSTAPITSIAIFANVGNLVIGSRVSLYGLRSV